MRDRVLPPGLARDRIGLAGPEIHDESAVQMDGDRGAELAALLEAAGERFADRSEARIAESKRLDGHGRSMPGNGLAVLFSTR